MQAYYKTLSLLFHLFDFFEWKEYLQYHNDSFSYP